MSFAPNLKGKSGSGVGWGARVRRIAFAACATLSVVSVGWLVHWILPPPDGPVPGHVVHIPEGATTRQIGSILESEGIIRSAGLFTLITLVTGMDGSLQAGAYPLGGDLNLIEVIGRLRDGRVDTVVVTIPEGLRLREIATLLAEHQLVEADEFIRLASDERLVFPDGPPISKPVRSLEGYLFPDTYRFAPAPGEAPVIRRLVARFVERVVPAVSDRLDEAGLSLHEAVTLASIIEKEAAVTWERHLIAAVFLNRLRLGMPLQSDPTVQYALQRPPGPLRFNDLRVDSPYNTYLHPGLPPGPIASPGLASVEAVFEPADSSYLYFVARGDGTHAFSHTYEEHLQAQAQSRQAQR